MPRADRLRRPSGTHDIGKRGRKRPQSAPRRNAVRLGCEMLEPRELMSATPWDLSPAFLASCARPAVDARLSAVPADTAGNTLAAARTLNVGAGSVSVRESVGARDTNDYFRFTLSANSRVSLSLTGLTKDANLQLIRDANNNRRVDGADVLATSAKRGVTSESVSERTLAAGTYFARVYFVGGDTYYTLAVTARTVPPADQAGNTLATARRLGTVSDATVAASDWLGWADNDDYYAVTLANTSDVTVTLASLAADADLQLICDANGNRVVEDGEILATSATRGLGNETIARQLSAATYYVRAARCSGDTTYRLIVSAAPCVLPDNDLGLLDTGLAALTASLFVDGSLSRDDMISLLRSAGSDDSRVDAAEMADFRTILTNAAQYQLQDYVRSLTRYVVNGNQANASFQGQALGNLAAGSSATQLNRLVDKWFLGADRPDAGGYGYQTYAGQLFVSGAAYTDIEQGQVGDCYLMATFGALAKSNPNAVTSMFIDNGDNTYTVRFFGSTGAAEYVTVNCQLPTASWGGPVYAGVGTYSASAANNELWVALLEKAYVQWNETGGTGRTDARNAYQAIAGGWMNEVYSQTINRYGSCYMNWADSQQSILVNAVLQNQVVTLGSRSSSPGNGVVANHAYILTGYNAQTGTFSCYNPWGTNHAGPLTWSQLKTSFLAASIA